MTSALCAAEFAALFASVVAAGTSQADETPKRGGILTYMIPADAPPSFDAHRETTYVTVHAVAPFYSVLIRLDPEHPEDTTKFVCDLCTEMPTPTDNGTTYTFKIRERREVPRRLAADRRRCGGKLGADHPPAAGLSSARETWYKMVDTHQRAGSDDRGVPSEIRNTDVPAGARRSVYRISTKRTSSTRIRTGTRRTSWAAAHSSSPAMNLASRSRANATRTTTTRAQPYLDGFVGIYADKQVVRVEAIRGDRAATEFRGLPPAAVDQLKKELGDKITVQTSDWNCGNLITPNSKRKPFDDVRVRKALLLAIDQWHGAPALSKIANVQTVGGIVFPGSPLAATKEELQQIAGFWPDIDKSRAEARRLLKEAGAENLSFEIAEPQRRSALQVCRHLDRGRVEQDRACTRRRRWCRPARGSSRCAAATSMWWWKPTATAW